MKKYIYAIPKGDGINITKDKEYLVIKDHVTWFEMENDIGQWICCNWESSLHVDLKPFLRREVILSEEE